MGEKLLIPGELPGLNEIIESSKTHWAKYAGKKKEIDTGYRFIGENADKRAI